MGNGVNRPMLMHLLTRLRDPSVISLVAALLARLHTALRDDAGVELITQYSVLWPASVSKYVSIFHPKFNQYFTKVD